MDPRQYAQLRERQEGRYYGLGITIGVVDGDITVDVASSRARRRTSRASAAATSSRRSTARTRRAGRRDQAVREAARAEGHERRGRDQAARASSGLIPTSSRCATRSHPDDPAEFMIDAADRLRPTAATSPRTPTAIWRALARADDEGHEALCCSTSAAIPAGRWIRRSRGLEPLPAEGAI